MEERDSKAEEKEVVHLVSSSLHLESSWISFSLLTPNQAYPETIEIVTSSILFFLVMQMKRYTAEIK